MPAAPTAPPAVDPQPPASAPATAPPAATTATAALPDLDANEAAVRARHPDLARPDPAQPARRNEDAVRAVAPEVFGSGEAVDAVFDTLSPLVKDALAQQYPGASRDEMTQHRLQFLVRMRMYFSSWHDLIDHFRNFVRVKRQGGRVDIVLHRDAAVRLERVLDLLTRHNHPLPSITGGFQLRHFDQGDIQSAGYMVHALGYAIDIAAAENPKIGFRDPGVGRFDPYGIAANIAPGSVHMDMGPGGLQTVKAMGQRMANDNSTLAADDQDPAAKAYFKLFEQRFQAMREGSLGFLSTLSADHRTKLLDLRRRHLDVLRKIRAQRDRRPADPKAMADLQEQRRATLAQIPVLVTEWIDALDRAVATSLAAHPGMAALRPPAEIRADLRHADENLRRATQDAARATAAKSAAAVRHDAATAAYRTLAARAWRAPAGAASDKAFDAAQAASRRMAETREEAVAAEHGEIAAIRARSRAKAARDALAAELATSDVPALSSAWEWITKYRELRDELAAPDLSPAGIGTFEALTTGDLAHIAPPDNPPLLRLLEVGYFNPKDAFDLEFFEEMAHSGLVPGATWQFGGADPMHFELQEGKDRIGNPGTL
ncbi:hypothetical protein [Streptomyces sp. NPDC088350]|uniref:hypothetical protein n=1 Tax=Streptomyces sp. NPDC088350 TaxID=3365854 RepID=UPI0037F63AD0